MSALWIALWIAAVIGGLLFAGWVVVSFIEAIAKEVMKRALEMTHPLTPREKVAGIVSGAEVRVEYDSVGRQYAFVRDAVGTDDAILTALASGSGDHAELAACPFCGGPAKSETLGHGKFARTGVKCADADCPGSMRLVSHDEDGVAFWNRRPREAALLAEIAALRSERDRISGESIWWKAVIGDGSHQPSGEVRSIKHLHPAMVKPIYEANKGTAVADVIAGLIFSLAITQNREQFLVADANERRTEAERKLAEAVGLLREWRDAFEGLGSGAGPLIIQTRAFLSKEAERG